MCVVAMQRVVAHCKPHPYFYLRSFHINTSSTGCLFCADFVFSHILRGPAALQDLSKFLSSLSFFSTSLT